MKILLSILFLFFVCGCTKEEVPPDEDYTITSEQREHLEMLIERLCSAMLFIESQREQPVYYKHYNDIPDLTDEQRSIRGDTLSRDRHLYNKYEALLKSLYVEFYNRVMTEDFENFKPQMHERYEALISEYLEFHKMEPRKFLENHTDVRFYDKRK